MSASVFVSFYLGPTEGVAQVCAPDPTHPEPQSDAQSTRAPFEPPSQVRVGRHGAFTSFMPVIAAVSTGRFPSGQPGTRQRRADMSAGRNVGPVSVLSHGWGALVFRFVPAARDGPSRPDSSGGRRETCRLAGATECVTAIGEAARGIGRLERAPGARQSAENIRSGCSRLNANTPTHVLCGSRGRGYDCHKPVTTTRRPWVRVINRAGLGRELVTEVS